ncbi:uncharacterized protein LOC129590000 isoform X2 [Paramacrobiotus metropolitanus]|nr:uncharacterized protein LOC129590000 isoform X2 [Paramacrobiotus metropolitanus]
MAVAMSQPPTKAVKITLYDGDLVIGKNLAAIRERVVILDISNFTSVRTTGKLPKLRLPNVLDFKLHNCYNLEIVRSDFWQSMQLHVIAFANTTIASLERNTFTDLPALQGISLEAYLGTIMNVFNEPMRGFLQRLHCGCEYEWYRKWWATRKMLHQAAKGDIYQTGGNSWDNEERNKTDMYLPINCAIDPFPVDVAAIDFTQESFTVNEDFYLDKWHSGCGNGSENSEESYPEFSTEPMSSEEIAVSNIAACSYYYPSVPNAYNAYGLVDICQEWEGANFSDSRVDRIRQVSLSIAKLPPRPVALLIGGNRTSVTFDDLAPIRKQVVRLMVSSCSNSRATKTLAVLRLTNLLEYEIINCDDLDVKNNDFLHSKKLRVIFFTYTTIRTL